MGKLIIDGNSVYEIDEECMRKKEIRKTEEEKERVLQQEQENSHRDSNVKYGK